MTEFEKTNWAKPDFGRQFIEEANVHVVERRKMLKIVKSFFRHNRKSPGGNRVLDLGCGDGILTHELLAVDTGISATMVDGSGEMLKRAGERLKGFKGIEYVQASFQRMIETDIIPGRSFDFIISSLAIHHLAPEEKKSLFGYVCPLSIQWEHRGKLKNSGLQLSCICHNRAHSTGDMKWLKSEY